MTITQRFRKLPVEIDAVQLTEDNLGEVAAWVTEQTARPATVPGHGQPGYLLVHTLEGEMRAEIGDWLIRGVAGEVYPCKPSIFAATYEPVQAQG